MNTSSTHVLVPQGLMLRILNGDMIFHVSAQRSFSSNFKNWNTLHWEKIVEIGNQFELRNSPNSLYDLRNPLEEV